VSIRARLRVDSCAPARRFVRACASIRAQRVDSCAARRFVRSASIGARRASIRHFVGFCCLQIFICFLQSRK